MTTGSPVGIGAPHPDVTLGDSVKKTDEVNSSAPAPSSVSGETRAVPSYQKLEDAVRGAPLYEPYKQNLCLLKDLQIEHLNIEEEYRREWNIMKLKYLQRFQPLYEKRRAILKSKPATEPTGDGPCGTSGIPGFWLKALTNNLLLEEMIETQDKPILNYLEDIVFSWVDPEEQSSFKLDFFFAENPFFTNTVLSKTYYLERVDEDSDESLLVKTVGTEINWNPGKDVTQKVVTRRQRNKRTHQTRMVTQTVDQSSFFNFFRSHEIPSEEQLEVMDDTEVNGLEMLIEGEYEVGTIIRDKIIPRALGWYLQIELDDEVSSAGEMQEEFDEDEEDEDDDEEENEDDEKE